MFKLITVLKYLGYYFRYKNKLLFQESNWASGTRVIKDLDKYDVIACQIYSFTTSVLLHRATNNYFIGVVTSAGADTFNTCSIYLRKTGVDTYEFSSSNLQHNALGSHSTMYKNMYGVSRIIGIEPNLSMITEISTGGGVLNLLASLLSGGVRHDQIIANPLENWSIYQREQSKLRERSKLSERIILGWQYQLARICKKVSRWYNLCNYRRTHYGNSVRCTLLRRYGAAQNYRSDKCSSIFIWNNVMFHLHEYFIRNNLEWLEKNVSFLIVWGCSLC